MNLWQRIILLVFFAFAATGGKQYVGTDISTIQEKVTSLRGLSDARKGESVVFPQLRFNCSGNISTIWFVARENIGMGRSLPQFQLWSRTLESAGGNIFLGTQRASQSPTNLQDMSRVDARNEHLYRYTLSNPLQFKEGYVFGMKHENSPRLIVRYQNNGGVNNYKYNPFTRQFEYSAVFEGRMRLPLVSVDTPCAERFISKEVLQQYPYDIPQDAEEYVFPSLSITEDGILEKWMFAATITSRHGVSNLYPEFQVWRRVGGNTNNITKVISTIANSSSTTNLSNVHVQTLSTPQPVMAGDFLGVLVPEHQIPSGLLTVRPQWIVGTGPQYGKAVQSFTMLLDYSYNYQVIGKAIPLFGALLRASTSSQLPTTDNQISSSLQPSATSTKPPTTQAPSTQSHIYQSSSTKTFSTQLHLSQTPSIQTTSTQLPKYKPSLILLPTIQLPSTEPFSTQPLSTLPSSAPTPPSSSSASGSVAVLAAVIVVVVVLLILSILFIIGLVLLCWAKKRGGKGEKLEQNGHAHKTRDSVFDNPVYDLLNTAASSTEPYEYDELPEPSGYAELPEPYLIPTLLRAPVELETTSSFSQSTNFSSANLNDGYATPIVHKPSPRPSYSSNSSSPLPSSSSSLHLLHQYHTLTEPQPAPHFLDPATMRREQSPLPPVGVVGANICNELTLERKGSEHDYHELDPAGGYYRLYQEGIYVPTEEQRKLSLNQKDVYVSLRECLYAPLSKGAGEHSLTFFEESEIYWKPASCTSSLYEQLAQKKYREIFEDQIKILHSLGSGQFGEVNKGVWQSPHGPVEVAVKTLKRGASEEDAVRFLQEAAIMGQFRHPNIVELLGVVTLGERAMIVLEYASHGDLNSFLVNQRPISGSQVPGGTEFRLLDFCKDVAHGMEYLQRKAFVHRDLAARNILVSKNNTCKIGDFGMSRDLLSENYYISKGGKVPIKWTAPEALNYNKYSTASDVWSFGVVMYEIWSLGHKPFENYTNLEVQQLILTGKRMAPPPGCPRGVYCLMIECWHPDNTCRPSFFDLLKALTTSPSELLNWSAGDTRGVPQMELLGGPLDASKNLFPDLQDIYIT